MNHLINHYTYIALLSSIALLLVGCSGEPPVPAPSGPIGIGVKCGVQLSVSSRATKDDPDPSQDPPTPPPLDAVSPVTVGVYGVMSNDNGSVFSNQKFYNASNQSQLLLHPDFEDTQTLLSYITGWMTAHNNNPWAYEPIKHWTPSRKYQFYAYSPWSPGSNMQINSLAYGGMQSLVWRNLPPFSQYDYVVAEGIVERDSGEMPHFIMKHHVTARICFRFRIEQSYNLLRDIEVTKVEIDQNQVGLTYTDCTIDLSQPIASFSLNTGNEYVVPEGSIMELMPEYTPDGTHSGLMLNGDEYALYSSVYAVPQTVVSLTATVTYNVYDKSGEITRTGEKAKNTIPINTELRSGEYYNINILIDPDYLYVLSDNDVAPDLIITSNSQ